MDYYNRAGRAVYACAMDLSKAFDLVSWEVLFTELVIGEGCFTSSIKVVKVHLLKSKM